MAVSRHFSMVCRQEHYRAVVSGDLSTVKSFLLVHPDVLNGVRPPLPLILFLPFGEGRREEEEEEEEKERNSP